MKRRTRGSTEPHYYSNHLQRKLNEMLLAPAAIVEAPSGYGKTTAIRDFLKTWLPAGTPVYWFTATEETPAAGFRRLCREFDRIDSRAGERLLRIELPNVVTVGEAAAALRSIQCPGETYLVIDNFQLLQNVLLPSFFMALMEHGGEGLHIIIVTQMLTKKMLALVTGRGILHITIADLRLNDLDIRGYYTMAGVNITLQDAKGLEKYTGGWIIALYLQLCALRETGTFSDTSGIMSLMEHLVWDGLSEPQQTFLLHISPFEMVTVSQACTLCGWETLPQYAGEALAIPFIQYVPAEQRYELHSILSELLIQKRRERGAAFEYECLLRAGDLCARESKISEALGFYAQIKDYERMLSLNLSNMILEDIGNMAFSKLAFDIAQNCPVDLKMRHILSMLQVAWALLTAGMKEPFDQLMKELRVMLAAQEEDDDDDDGSWLLGEWLFLSSFEAFPHLEKMTPVLRQAAVFFGDKCSRVILPTAPWCFGIYSQLSVFHIEPGKADREADALEEYTSLYSRLTSGNGCGADVLFRAELALHRGDINDAEILAYKALLLAESRQQSIVQLGATQILGHIALYKADTAGWQRAISSMERAASFASQNTFVNRAVLDIVRGALLCELQDQKSIAEWLQKGDFSGRRLLPSMIPDALFVHIQFLMYKREYARFLGTMQALETIGIRPGPLNVVLKWLSLAVCHLLMGDRDRASILVEQAGESALPDGMIFLFASFSLGLQRLNDQLIEQKYPSLADKFHEVRRHLLSGWDTLSVMISPDELPSDLTPREYEVAKLAAEGLSNKEIAEKLVVSESTVRTHLRTVFQKLEIDRRTKLAEKLK